MTGVTWERPESPDFLVFPFPRTRAGQTDQGRELRSDWPLPQPLPSSCAASHRPGSSPVAVGQRQTPLTVVGQFRKQSGCGTESNTTGGCGTIQPTSVVVFVCPTATLDVC